MTQAELNQMLRGAKAVMKKVDEGDYSTGNVSLGGTDGTRLVESIGNNKQMSVKKNNSVKVVDGQPVYKNMETSKLPNEIKKVMIDNFIPEMSMANSTFTLDDVDTDLINGVTIPAYTPNKINERIQQHNDNFTVSETALRGIIRDVVKDELFKFMEESYSKKITEQAIKKTINTLIKEGKIKTKKNLNG